VRSGDVVAATGNLVIVLAAPDSPTAIAWPDEVREALIQGGPQAAETYA
jgi:acyl-CoA thioesterase FadM